MSRWPLVLIALCLPLGFAAGWFAFSSGRQHGVETVMCDRQVAILLNTKDLVELERAMFIIRRLDCDIGRRLPR